MKKKFKQITDPDLRVVNITTGEIMSSVKRVEVEDANDFIFVFLDNLKYLCELDGLELKLLMECCRYSIYADSCKGNILWNDADFKKSVVNDGLDLAPATIDVYISKLYKKGFLIRLSKGKYIINPNYFFKGKLSDRRKLNLDASNI